MPRASYHVIFVVMQTDKFNNECVMKKLLITIIIAVATICACQAQLRYQCQNAPDAEVTVVSGGVMIDIDNGAATLMLFPQGFLSSYMYYAATGVSALFTSDLTSMLLYVGGQTYQYTLTAAPANASPGFNYPPVPAPVYTPPAGGYDYSPSEADKAYYRNEIRELRYKIKDAERSLRMYERNMRRDPSISSSQLVQSQRRLIDTYYERLYWLESQLY